MSKPEHATALDILKARDGLPSDVALEYAPGLAPPLFRRALRSPVPACRCTAAAALALIDRPWGRRELLAVLEESDDQEATADCRAALLEYRGEEGRRAVEAWEARNPHEQEAGAFLNVGGREVGPFFSMREVMLRDRSAWVRAEMDKLHDRVMKVRDRLPAGPAAGA